MTDIREQLADTIYNYTPGISTDESFKIAAAVRRDFIVIPRADLGEVREENGRAIADANEEPYHANAEGNPWWSYNYALNVLAVHEYIKAKAARPTVDEAEVSTLADLLIGADMDGEEGQTPITVARRLLATGRVYLAKEA